MAEDRVGKVVLGQQTADASWHSIHAGKTVDEAITGFKEMSENIASLNSWMATLDEVVAQVKNALSLKYDKIGGPIGEQGVQITGNGNADKSTLTTRFIDGLSVNGSSELYLNANGRSNIYFCSSPNSSGTKAYITPAGKVFGAVWNDFAEYRESEEKCAGRVICECGDGTLKRSTKRLQPGAEIVSDTFGFAIGETKDCKTPVAVAGRVLAYTDKKREKFQAGDAVCAGPNGTVSKMSRKEIRKYPDRIIGTVSEIPDYDVWGDNEIPVNGRIWIRIR